MRMSLILQARKWIQACLLRPLIHFISQARLTLSLTLQRGTRPIRPSWAQGAASHVLCSAPLPLVDFAKPGSCSFNSFAMRKRQAVLL